MLEFLSSFLLLIFSLNAAVSNEADRTIVFENLSENLPIISITPAAYHAINNIFEEENSENPRENKVETYNTASEKVIENVSNEGVEHSPTLMPCIEDPTFCDSPGPSLPEPPIPEPTPIIITLPEFKGPPEIIPVEPPTNEPPTPTITPPKDPCSCVPDRDTYCIMLYCPEAI